MNTTATPAPLRTLDDDRRAARARLGVPTDDGGELTHHLVSRYLDRCSADAPDGTGHRPLPDARTLLAGLGRLFSAVADRHGLSADDPALLGLAELLLAEPAAPAVALPASRGGSAASRELSPV
ncbi:hypothetical protein [Kineococcus sp. SYSU DK001]|uniref:hypothetical protein n=1 Tax=Kineococcus sp. SYSU DK001 TaxID=3383122 RepID=UPI003D7DFF37